MNYFSIKERQVGDITVLDIRGKLKGCGGRCILRNSLIHPFEKGHNQIILNLAQVSGIDSSCLGELISIHFYLKNRGAIMRIVLSQILQQLIAITNLMTTLDVYDNEADARDKFLCDTIRLRR